MFTRLYSLLRSLGPDEAQPLQVRLFRIFTGLTAWMCVLVVVPANLFEHTPIAMNTAVVVLGSLGAGSYLLSRRGTNLYVTFFVLLVAVIDVIWFMDAGPQGDVSFCFFAILVYPIVTFQGWRRIAAALFLMVNLQAIYVVDYYVPKLALRYGSTGEKLADHLVTICACMIGLGVLVRLVLSAYQHEQQRISVYAKELASAEARYRALYNSTYAALFVYGEDGRLVDVNDGAAELFECPREELLGSPPGSGRTGLTPGEIPELSDLLKRALRERTQAVRRRVRRKGGSEFWSEVNLNTAEVDGIRMLVVSLRDISMRVAAEEAMRLNEERLRMALSASNQGWFDINVQTGEGTASGEYAKILGLEPADFKVSRNTWLEGIHPDDRKLMMEEFAVCVAEGGPRVMEYRRKSVDGQWKWIRSVGKIVDWDRNGRALRMIGTHTDVTERRMLEAQLMHSQRLDSVGTLAGGVAHELNNILTPMLMAGPTICEKLANHEDQVLMEQMEAGARRGAAIVQQLLAFSRNLDEKRVSVDTHQVLQEMRGIMQAIFPRNLTIVVQVGDELWPVQADPVQFHQVIMNLCINARDAMPDGGKLVVRAANVEGGLGMGRMVSITVSDTGHGIPHENLSRIFDPFFTTKDVGKGTGLGLSMVHGILKSHGGSITVESEVGRGSTFRVLLPASATLPKVAVARHAQAPFAGRRPVVLVVDDESLVLRVTVRALERQGYEVLAAGSGIEALSMAEGRKGPLDLILTDIMMPEMDGPTLVSRLRVGRPNLPVVGVSGLNLEYRSAELKGLGFVEILRKPYELVDLLGAVRRHLNVDSGGRPDAPRSSPGTAHAGL